MLDKQLTALAERFCATPLPDSVCADVCATQQGPGRVGTNLLTVAEAKKVLAHILSPTLATVAAGDDEGVALRAAEALLPYTSHAIGCAIYQQSWSKGAPECTCGVEEARAAIRLLSQGGGK
jgi:hypothetical protein